MLLQDSVRNKFTELTSAQKLGRLVNRSESEASELLSCHCFLAFVRLLLVRTKESVQRPVATHGGQATGYAAEASHPIKYFFIGEVGVWFFSTWLAFVERTQISQA